MDRTTRGMEVEDVHPPWDARERLVLDNMERHVKRSERIQVDVCELEHFLPGPGDEEISTRSLAKNARDEGRDGKFFLIDTPRYKEKGRGAEAG